MLQRAEYEINSIHPDELNSHILSRIFCTAIIFLLRQFYTSKAALRNLFQIFLISVAKKSCSELAAGYQTKPHYQ
jgi:hypothetical protein